MYQDRIRVVAWVYLRPPKEGVNWVKAAFERMPAGLRPTHFGSSGRFLRKPEFELSGANELRAYAGGFFFHDHYSISTWSAKLFNRILLHASLLSSAIDLLLPWWAAMDEQLYYANAGDPAEYDHRNGYLLHTIGVTRPAHGWVGRDIRRYVPGLYWLNWFSREFSSLHGLNLSLLAKRSRGRLSRHAHGDLLRLYDSPPPWVEWRERIDEVLFTTEGFFSKRRVQFPTEPLAPKESLKVTVGLRRQWP